MMVTESLSRSNRGRWSKYNHSWEISCVPPFGLLNFSTLREKVTQIWRTETDRWSWPQYLSVQLCWLWNILLVEQEDVVSSEYIFHTYIVNVSYVCLIAYSLTTFFFDNFRFCLYTLPSFHHLPKFTRHKKISFRTLNTSYICFRVTANILIVDMFTKSSRRTGQSSENKLDLCQWGQKQSQLISFFLLLSCP